MSGARPEERVRIPMFRQRWRDVVFVHWPCDPDQLGGLLPEGLRVDTRDGCAWITLTPLAIEGSRPPLVPPVPGTSNYLECNVRTYVVGPDGRDGLWFFTLETDNVPTLLGGRAAFRLPYRRATMDRRRADRRITYTSRRRAQEPSAWTRTTVESVGDLRVADRELAGWLTGRWRAWTRVAGRLLAVPVEHEPWPLSDAELVDHEDTLRRALGLPAPSDDPVVHSAPGVTVRFGWPDIAHRR